MNRVSLKSGTRLMTHGSSVSSVAAKIGSAAFLLPLMSTVPRNGTPPLIKKLSMRNYVLVKPQMDTDETQIKFSRGWFDENLCFICENLWLKNQNRATRILAR